MPHITIYTQPECPPCEITKLFLTEHGFAFELKDIKKDHNARNELVKKYNSYTTPTIVVDNETVITGFDLERLGLSLGIKSI